MIKKKWCEIKFDEDTNERGLCITVNTTIMIIVNDPR